MLAPLCIRNALLILEKLKHEARGLQYLHHTTPTDAFPENSSMFHNISAYECIRETPGTHIQKLLLPENQKGFDAWWFYWTQASAYMLISQAQHQHHQNHHQHHHVNCIQHQRPTPISTPPPPTTPTSSPRPQQRQQRQHHQLTLQQLFLAIDYIWYSYLTFPYLVGSWMPGFGPQPRHTKDINMWGLRFSALHSWKLS